MALRPPSVSEPIKPVHVSVTTLDKYLQRFRPGRRVDFIKMDVEGAELEALKGAIGLLYHTPRPTIMCELADVRTEPWGYQSVEIYEYLATRGYKWFSITSNGHLRLCPSKMSFHENLIALPEEKFEGSLDFMERAAGK